jgi:HlyD family secretion protein
MTEKQKKWFIRAAGVLVIVVLALVAWQRYGATGKDDGLVSGNGRLEAVEIDIAARMPGRIKDILVKEGDFVTAGQVVAQMDTEVLDAQRREAEANLQRAQNAVGNAQSQLAQRVAEEKAALAVVAQREAELDVARKRLARTEILASRGLVAIQALDDDRAAAQCAQAVFIASQAQAKAAEANIATARSQVLGEQSAQKAVGETIRRIQADIDDSALKAPRDGRVQYRVAQPGEVVGAGGRLLSMVDLSDVYMTFFLPTAAAGRIALGTEVRLVLDVAPQYVIPAKASFVADVAQFTPKTVETASEREKLMFRIKAQIPVDLIRKHLTQVKTGLPGVAYVRLDSGKPWPAHLQVKLPQ